MFNFTPTLCECKAKLCQDIFSHKKYINIFLFSCCNNTKAVWNHEERWLKQWFCMVLGKKVFFNKKEFCSFFQFFSFLYYRTTFCVFQGETKIYSFHARRLGVLISTWNIIILDSLNTNLNNNIITLQQHYLKKDHVGDTVSSRALFVRSKTLNF